MTAQKISKEMIKPVRDQVLVKPFLTEAKTESGIILPESHRKPSSKVLVVDVGTGTKNHPMRFKRGDIAFRVKDTGTEIEYNGERYFILPQSYLLATQTEE